MLFSIQAEGAALDEQRQRLQGEVEALQMHIVRLDGEILPVLQPLVRGSLVDCAGDITATAAASSKAGARDICEQLAALVSQRRKVWTVRLSAWNQRLAQVSNLLLFSFFILLLFSTFFKTLFN